LNDSTAAEANDTAHPEPAEFAAADDFALSVEQPVGTLGVACIDVPEPGMAAAEGRVPAAIVPADDADVPEQPAPEAEAEAAQEAPEPLPLFSDLGLSEPILRAIAEKGYAHPTPIQAQAIPAVLSGRDVMGVAQTGTGKTAGFTLPMLDILSGSRARARMPRSLILEPTRELALQVAENFVAYGKYLKLTHALLIGGESLNDQKDVLLKGVDVLIAPPAASSTCSSAAG